MQQLLETIKAKLEALEAEGVAGVREIILHAEEAIGLHKAATDEFAEGAELLPGATTGDLGEGVHVIGVDVQADRIVTDPVHAIPGIEVTEGAPEAPAADAAPASSDPAPAA